MASSKQFKFPAFLGQLANNEEAVPIRLPFPTPIPSLI